MFQNFLPNAFSDMREDVNMLIQRDWQKDDLQDQREDAERAWFRNLDAQREFAQHGIQWRVKDAQEAGLHPLSVLGSSGAAFAPTVAIGSSGGVPSAGRGGFAAMGQNLSRAAKAGMDEHQRRMMELQELALQSQIYQNDSAADLNAARAEQVRRQTNASNGLGSNDPNIAIGLPGSGVGSGAGHLRVVPDESTSYAPGDPSSTAARKPMWSQFRLHDGPGGTWVLPHAKQGSEAFESIGEGIVPLWLTIAENMHRDPEFLRKNRRYIPFYDSVSGGLDFLDELGRSIGRAVAAGVHDPKVNRVFPKPPGRGATGRW